MPRKRNPQNRTNSVCKSCGTTFEHYVKEKRIFCGAICNLKGRDVWNKGQRGLQNAWNKGIKHIKVVGEKNGNWRGGNSKLSKLQVELAGRDRPQQCEVCYKSCKTDWDHSHETGKFRGWICRQCNLVLGLVKDDAKLLRQLALYLDLQDDSTRPKTILNIHELQRDDGNKEDLSTD